MKKLLIIIFSLLIPTLVFAAETQTNVSGSNTSIEGDIQGELQPMNLDLNLLQPLIQQVILI